MVLPAPLGPTNATLSPRSMRKSKLSNTILSAVAEFVAGYLFSNFFMSKGIEPLRGGSGNRNLILPSNSGSSIFSNLLSCLILL